MPELNFGHKKSLCNSIFHKFNFCYVVTWLYSTTLALFILLHLQLDSINLTTTNTFASSRDYHTLSTLTPT